MRRTVVVLWACSLLGLGCTRRPAVRTAPPPAEVCASSCGEELQSCMGNTLEDSRYSSCMPEHDACVTACFDGGAHA